MTTLLARADTRATPAETDSHPLEPLSGEEITAAIRILRDSGRVGTKRRFVVVTLHEPPKAVVLSWTPDTNVPREAAVQVLDNADGRAYEATVSLTGSTVTRWEYVPGVQPSLMIDEFFECEEAVKADPQFPAAALAKRGVLDMSLVMVDPWSAGWYGEESATYADAPRPARHGLGALRAGRQWLRPSRSKGVAVIFDLNSQEVDRGH